MITKLVNIEVHQCNDNTNNKMGGSFCLVLFSQVVVIGINYT